MKYTRTRNTNTVCLTYGRDIGFLVFVVFFFKKNGNKKVNKGLFVMRMGPDEVWGGEARENKVVLNVDVKQLNMSGAMSEHGELR